VKRKPSTNLTLSSDALEKGQLLKDEMNRPSLTNVVEALIIEKHRQLFGDKAGGGNSNGQAPRG